MVGGGGGLRTAGQIWWGFSRWGGFMCGSDIWVEVTTVSPVPIRTFGQQAEPSSKFRSNKRGRNP